MYPKYENTDIVSCFNCYQDHYNPEIHKSDYCTGKHYIVCDSCGMRTFLDIIEKEGKNATTID